MVLLNYIDTSTVEWTIRMLLNMFCSPFGVALSLSSRSGCRKFIFCEFVWLFTFTIFAWYMHVHVFVSPQLKETQVKNGITMFEPLGTYFSTQLLHIRASPPHCHCHCHNLSYFLAKSKSTHCHLLIPKMTLTFLPIHPSHLICFKRWAEFNLVF